MVSPLIALMNDQVDALRGARRRGGGATSAANAEEQRETIEGIAPAQLTLLYVAPERFRSPRSSSALRAIAGRSR